MSGINDLAYHIAHGYPGGVRPLAMRMRPPTPDDPASNYGQVLTNKLNPNNATHHLLASELENMADMAGANITVADYFSRKCNAVVVQLEICNGSDVEVLDGFLAVMSEFGEFCAEFQKDWADGHLKPDEFQRLSKEARDVHVRLLSHMARIEQMVEWPKNSSRGAPR